jgi:hypothetical protein
VTDLLKVEGNCPMGCGRTLFVGEGGHVTCSWRECPNPTAVDEILADTETEHIVIFGERGFNVQHPLKERLKGTLFNCELVKSLTSLQGPPVLPGKYRFVDQDGEFAIEKLD